MTIRIQAYDNKGNTVELHTFKAQEVLMMTADTFGGIRKMNNGDSWVKYHGCNKTDNGACFVVVTRTCIDHVFPKDAEALIVAE